MAPRAADTDEGGRSDGEEVGRGSNPLDPVLTCLAENTLLLYVEGTPEHTRMLVERFRKHPKPMYYQPQFLETKWAEYKALNGIARDDEVDPDGVGDAAGDLVVVHVPGEIGVDDFGIAQPFAPADGVGDVFGADLITPLVRRRPLLLH